MISQSGVVWNIEQNYLYATLNQWDIWRELYPMARAYMAQGDPLYNELKALFAPDDSPQDGPSDDDEMIIIMDSDDEDFPPLRQPVVHALHALDQVDWNHILVPDSPIPEIVVISSDDDGYDLDGYFDSNVELDYSDDENHIPVVMIEEAIGEVVDPIHNINPARTTSSLTVEDESISLTAEIPIPSTSLAAIRAAIGAIPLFRFHDNFSSSDEYSD